VLVKETPFFALQVMKTLARRLRRMDVRMLAAAKTKKARRKT
jgi:hypothetical protein